MQDYLENRCIHQLFEEQVDRAPSAIAAIFETEQISYEALNQRANRLAHHLRKRQVKRDVTVGIHLNRSVNTIVSILGVLKAGGAYVPLDPENPIERNRWILRETRVALLLTDDSLHQNALDYEGEILCLDCVRDVLQNQDSKNPPATGCLDDLAYVMYTSGSTGKPKGVSVIHRGVVNYLDFLVKTYGINTNDVVLQLPSFSFDASFRDLIGPLTAGARVVVIRQADHKDPFALLQKINQHKVTCLLSLTPTVLRNLTECALENSQYSSIRLLLVSGEVFPAFLIGKARKLFGEKVRLVNQYGPTEGTLTCTYFRIPENLHNQGTVPIGRPIPNCNIYILDGDLHPVAVGERGELYIGGVGVARGYFNRPELTAEKFIANPFSPGERLYKSGDLARQNSDGDIEFLGRIDHQVIIRGSRVEPEEIEAVLSQHPGVKESVVIARETATGEKKLVAYLIAERSQTPSANELRSHLRKELPEYMVPSVYIFLDSFPVSVNGKVDRLSFSEATTIPESTSIAHLTEEEKGRVLVEWNDTRKDYPRDSCVDQLFEEQVARTPRAVALVSDHQILTYDELNRSANRLAHTLQSLGVQAETTVGLFAHRSVSAITGMLAILKAGGAYVPLDPEYSAERLAFLLEDTKPIVVLTERGLERHLPDHNASIIILDQYVEKGTRESESNPVSGTTAENLCYIMYTSGSTGQPKGVCIPHRGVVRLVRNTNFVRLAPDETLLQLTQLSFDVSTLEIWGALLNGARLVVPPAGSLSTHEIGDILRKHHVTTLCVTPWIFHEMVDSNLEDLKGLRQLLSGGDVLSVSHATRAVSGLPNCQLINAYGPTEITTFNCSYPIPASIDSGKSVPIGRPIANSTVYILDDRLQPVAIGEIGEIYLGGDGLARGYLNRPDLTAEKFIPNPFVQDRSHLYKSGDLGRWLPEGIIEFLGRVDDQVKIRGFRVEPGEVETILTGHPAIRQAVIVARRSVSGENRLLAYLLCHEKRSTTTSELREFLKQKLPNYMIPSQFVFLEAFPLTPNGKIDRRALPEPSQIRDPDGSDFVRPRSEAEQAILAIWMEILEKDEIGVHDDFFAIGGDSLLATRVTSRIRKRFNIEFPLRVFFEKSTIAELAQEIQIASEI